jgi:PKD repeat protein
MNKIARILTILVLVLSILTINSYSASAEPIFVGFLDTFETSNDGSAGPIFTGQLLAGELYLITVEGTLSVWRPFRWDSVCEGTPEPSPIFPSPSTDNGKVGLDTVYIFSYPTGSSVCPEGVPLKSVPYQHMAFQISADGGSTWASLDPKVQTFNPSHIYQYEVTATAATQGFGFRFSDHPLIDNYGQLKITVELINHPPSVETGGPYFGDEGSPVAFDGSGSFDPDGHSITFSWDFGDGNTGVGVNPVHTYADNDDFPVCLTVTDIHGASTTVCTTAFISNVAPSVGPISVDATIIPIGTTINANADFTDPGTADTHTAVWDWGDGSSSPGIVTEANGSGSVTGSHAYTAVGKYQIGLTVTDDDNDSDATSFQFVVVFDPTEPSEPETVILSNCFKITFLGYTDHRDGTSTWSYRVEELPCAKDLSNWVLELPSCASVVDASPSPWEKVHPDPNIHLNGIKWEVGDGFVKGEFSVTLSGDLVQGTTQVGAKGPDVAVGTIIGPECVGDDGGGGDGDDGDDVPGTGKGNNGNGDDPGNGKGNNGNGDDPGTGKGNNGNGDDPGTGKGNNGNGDDPGNGKGNNGNGDDPGNGKGNKGDGDDPGNGKGNKGDSDNPGNDKGNKGDADDPANGKGSDPANSKDNNGDNRDGRKEGKGD